MKTILSCAVVLILAAVGSAQEDSAPKAPRTHTVVPKDCLWDLAKAYYGNPFRWKVIYSANTEKIKDPHWIYPGQVFVIPDVPGPEIGEVGARPVETGAKVEVPAEEPPVVEAAAPASTETQAKAAEPEGVTDDLREELPPGLIGHSISMTRVMEARGWKEDGKITEYEGREGTAAAGDWVRGKIKGHFSASVGDKFTIFRRDVPQILDEDKEATYLQKVGTVELNKALGGSKYRFLILKSGDTVQPGDLIKKEAL